MPETQTHIIHTLKYDIQFQNAEANGQEEYLSKLHHEYFAGVLEEVFDKYAPDGKYLTGDTIEIDLGLIQKNDLLDAFKTKMNAFFEEKLIHAREPGSEKNERSMMEIPEKEDDLTILSSREHKILMLLHFLKKAYFNWHYSGTSNANSNTLFKEALQKYPDHLEPAISTLLLDEPDALKRFIFQIEPVLQIQYFEQIAKGHKEMIHRIDAMPALLLEFPGIDKQAAEQFMFELKKVFYTALLRKQQIKNEDDFIRENIQALGNSFDVLLSAGIADSGGTPAGKAKNPLLNNLMEVLADIRRSHGEKEIIEKVLSVKEDADKKADKTKSKLSAKVTDDKEVEKGIMANNAGLLLLWPYLGKLFKTFDLIEGNNFKGETEQIQAVFMLNYLAGNTGEVSEHLLLVPKILCGMEISTPLPLNFDLDEKAKKECDKLLQAAINNWDALKATSVSGLQTSFLQREGLVKSRTDHFEFSFERQGIDILIDKLPFALSIINFSWTQYHIHIIW